MHDKSRTKEQLLNELAGLRQRIAELEKSQTKHKQDEEALARSESKYRELVQNANSVILRWKRDGTIIFINEFGQTFFGYSAEELIGRQVSILVREKDSAGADLTKLVLDIVDHPERYVNNVNENICRDGRLVWMSWTNKPIFDEDGRVAEILAVGTDITELKQAEEAAWVASQNLQSVLINAKGFFIYQAVPDETFTYGARVLMVSPSVTDVSGMTDIYNFGAWFENIHPDDLPRILEANRHSIATHETFDEVMRWHHRLRNEWIWIHAISNPVYDQLGRIIHFNGLFIDITAQKKAEEALQRERDILQTIMDSAGKAQLVYLDRDFNFVRINETYAAGCGYRPEEMIGKNHFALYPSPGVEAIFSHVRDTGEDFEVHDRPFEYPDQPERGVTYWDWTLKAIKDSGDQVTGLVFSLYDTTERKRAKDELAKAHEQAELGRKRLEAVLEATPSAVVLIEASTDRFLYVNRRAMELYGTNYVGSDLNNHVMQVNALRPDGTPYPFQEMPISHSLKFGKEVRNEEMIIERTDGTRMTVLVSSAPLFDAEGNVTSAVGCFDDITDRKEAEAALKRSLERFAIISDTASQLLMSQTPQLIIEDVCHKVMKHLDCHVFFNFLVDGERNCLRLNAYAGIPEQTAREIHFLDYGVAVCGCAARDACRIVAENIPTTPDIRTDLVRSFGVTAYACHPLFAQGQVIGTLSFGTKSRLTFTDDELSLMKTVADQVATAMERIRLLRSAEERGDELEAKVLERTTQLRKQADLLDLAHDAVILSDTEGTISFWNKGAEDTYGFTREEAVGKSLHALLQTESDIPLEDIKGSVVNEGRWEGELLHTRKDGDKVTVHTRWVLRHDDVTGSSEIMEVNRDITQRKRAEKALAMISAYNRSLIETSIDPLATINSQGMISDVNIATERVTGYPRDKLIGTDFCDYFTDPTKAKAVYEQVFREETVRDYELEILHKDGRTTPVLYNASVYRNEAGKVVGVFAAARDITERRYMEQILRESEERYRTAIESASDGVALMRGDQHIYVNKRFSEMFGYSSPSEILGKSHSLTVHPDDLAMVSQINMMRQNGEPVPSRYEFRGIRKDGTLRNIEVSATMINYRGEPASLVYLRDITDYKNLEEQLRQAHKMEAIGTLAGGIAHDFNNILAAIIGFTEMVEEDLTPESPSIPRIQRVLNAASRGRDLVRQILAFSRKTEPTRKPLSLSPVIKETVELLRASLPTTIEIRLSIKAARDTVLASSAELQQILMNLTTNASFSMKEKGGILGISVTNIDFAPDSPVLDADVEPGEYVQIVVQDSGFGMSPDIVQRIFEPFFTTKGVGEGTGMGLPVVYGVVKSLNGTIAVESEPGVGSTFRIFLPVARTDEKPEDSGVQVTPKGTEHILFVDDEEFLTEWGQAALERLGYTVTALTDSTQALNLFSSDPSRFDLVIVDQTMPKLTGLHLARKLLTIRNNIPIILCTGHSDSVSPEKAKEAGIREFLMKPLGKQALAQLIRRLLDTKSEG